MIITPNITQRTFSLLAYLAVGLRLDFLSICWHPSISVQVIYKKFQIACPFEEFSVNGTANLLSLNISSAHGHDGHDGHDGHEYTNGVAHEDDDSHCATHLFTINSQVGSCIEHWLCLSCFFFFIQRAAPVWEFPWLLFFHDESSYLSMSPPPADRVHYSHPRFCLCVPPGGTAHLHRAPQVSHRSIGLLWTLMSR